MNIYDFSKLNRTDKVKLLCQKAIIIELHIEKETTRQVYSLSDFFVEVTITDGKVLDYIPFLSDYRMPKKSFVLSS